MNFYIISHKSRANISFLLSSQMRNHHRSHPSKSIDYAETGSQQCEEKEIKMTKKAFAVCQVDDGDDEELNLSTRSRTKP